MAITAGPARVSADLADEEWEVEIQPSSRYHTEGELEPGLVLRLPRPVASVREGAIEAEPDPRIEARPFKGWLMGEAAPR
jgi:hypothetical protein